jgi:hypothetical protein
MRAVWHWFGKLVRRPRSSEERLRMAVDSMQAYSDHLAEFRADVSDYADDVLRLLHRDERRTASRSGSRYPRGAWTRSIAGTIPSDSYTSGSGTTYVRLTGHGDE